MSLKASEQFLFFSSHLFLAIPALFMIEPYKVEEPVDHQFFHLLMKAVTVFSSLSLCLMDVDYDVPENKSLISEA